MVVPSALGDLPYGERYLTDQAPDVAHPQRGWLLIASAVLLVGGAVLPWVHIDERDVTLTGLDLGWFTAGWGGLIGLMGVLIVLRLGRTWVGVVAMCTAVATLVVMIFMGDSIVHDQASKYLVEDSEVSVRYGMWLSMLAAMLAVGSAVWAFLDRSAAPRGATTPMGA